jgi:HSP20 family molecular chaperone IbpA
MSNVLVRKVTVAEILPRQLQEEMQSFTERIRAKAYERFLSGGARPGRELNDWLEAERELAPETELSEKDREFQARIDVTGLESKGIEVIVTQNAILLESPREAKLLQRIELAKSIDPDRVTAKLEKGILQVICPKRAHGTLTASHAG